MSWDDGLEAAERPGYAETMYADADHRRKAARENPTEVFFFTFGTASPNARRYVRIEARSWVEAQAEMTRRHGREWGMQYASLDWTPDGLTELR